MIPDLIEVQSTAVAVLSVAPIAVIVLTAVQAYRDHKKSRRNDNQSE